MIENIQKYIAPFVALDKPIPYKDLLIYPIKVEDYDTFDRCKDIFMIDKNKIADVEIIQMTDLDFLVKRLISDSSPTSTQDITMGTIYYTMFVMLMQLCLHIDIEHIEFYENNKHIQLKLNNIDINNNEYIEIKRIILYQNLINYDDKPMSDDVKEAITEYYRIVNKDIVPITLEDMIDVIVVDTHYTLEYIHKLTYRRFTRLFERICDKLNYQVGSYGYTREKPPEHYIYKHKKDKYSEVFTDMNQFEQKFNSV